MIPEEAVLQCVARDLAQALLPLIDARVDERIAAVLQQQRQREWVTLAEAAKALDLSPAATRMRVKRGRLEGRTDGRRVYVKAASVRRAAGDV